MKIKKNDTVKVIAGNAKGTEGKVLKVFPDSNRVIGETVNMSQATTPWPITYGTERLAMYLQEVDSVYDLVWTDVGGRTVTYGEVFHQNEVEQSTYNFEHADVDALFGWFDTCEREARKLVDLGLPLPAYEQVLKASHTFNLLDARKAISVTERQRFILRVRDLARRVAESYYASREALGFPGLAAGAKESNHD